MFSTPCYLLTRCGGFTGYRLCRRPLRLESLRTGCLELHVALYGDLWAWMGDDLGLHFGALGVIWLTAWKALGGMWAPLGQTGCSNELFGTPVQAGASI